MEEVYGQNIDFIQRIRDMEDKQMLTTDRLLLATKTIVEEKTKTFKEIQELKKQIDSLKNELARTKEITAYLSEQLSNAARKEEFSIIQRQLDLMRKQ